MGRFKRWQVRSPGRFNPVVTLPPQTGEADAYLIAAAPGLLEALERLLHSYTLLAEHKPVRDMAETLGEVRHAIAKAKGEG
jgi:hypothetical protein